jgi:hypothetical protein
MMRMISAVLFYYFSQAQAVTGPHYLNIGSNSFGSQEGGVGRTANLE